MNRFLKIVVMFYALGFLFCCSKTKDDPLTLPPNFAELPDLNNLEDVSKQDLQKKQQKEVAELKELLLQSD